MRTYKEIDSWKKFQPYFPKDWRISDNSYPDEYYWKWRSFNIHIDHFKPKKNKKKIKLILLHGGGGNGRLLSPVAVCFSHLGFECIAPDLPGFGLTEVGSPNSYYTWINLVDDLVNEEAKKSDSPIVLCGVSLGGMLAYQVASLNSNISGLIVTSLADTRDKSVQMGLAKNKCFGFFSHYLLNRLSFLTDKIKIPIKLTTKMWAMANNKEFVKELKKDKVGSGSWVYLKFFRTLFEANPNVEPEKFKSCPLLFLQPEKDFIIPWAMSRPFYEKLSCKKEVIFLENCGHIPMEKPGIDQMRDGAFKFLKELETL